MWGSTGDLLHFSDPKIDYCGVPTGREVEFPPNNIIFAARNNAGKIRGTGCIVSNFTESTTINGVVTIDELDCMLELTANVQPFSSEYEYFWYWSQDGLFTGDYPGELLGTGESLVVDEQDSDPCANYFIQLVVYLDGEIVDSEVVVQNGGICSDNVQPCSEPQFKEIQKEESIDGNEYETIENVLYVVDILGRVIYVNSQNKTSLELQNEISIIYKGVYIMVGLDSKNVKMVKKYISD